MTSPGDWIEWKGGKCPVDPQDDGRALRDGLSSPTEPASGLGPAGFDPSRGDVYVQSGVGFTSHTAWRTLTDGRQEPERDFWTVGVYDEDDPSAEGSAEVEIIEVVPTQHCGTLVVHRRSFIDPDGERRRGRRKTSSIGSLRAYLKRWGFVLRDSDGSPKGGDAEGGSVACDDSAGPKDIAQ